MAGRGGAWPRVAAQGVGREWRTETRRVRTNGGKIEREALPVVYEEPTRSIIDEINDELVNEISEILPICSTAPQL